MKRKELRLLPPLTRSLRCSRSRAPSDVWMPCFSSILRPEAWLNNELSSRFLVEREWITFKQDENQHLLLTFVLCTVLRRRRN